MSIGGGPKAKPVRCSIGAALVAAALLWPVQDFIDARAGEREEPDLLFFNSPSLVRKMALGFEPLLADIYWMRTIQYYGHRDEAGERRESFGNLYTLLDITTTLDPGLQDAYRAGSCFLSEPPPVGAGQPELALELLEKGARAHPREWRLVYERGFVHYLYLKDYAAAGETWLEAGRVPGAPEWLAGLAAMALSKGGAEEIAVALWRRQYEEATSEAVRDNARNHLHSLQVRRDLAALRERIERHRAATGSFPPGLGTPRDPMGTPYAYDPRSGRVDLDPASAVRLLDVP